MPADAAAPAGDPSRVGGVVNLLGGYDAPSLEPPTKMKKGGWTYPQHGSHYNPSICKERTRVKRDKRMRVAREKWEEETKQREAQRAKGQVKRERKNAESISEGESEGRSHPPRLCRNTSSGTSASSSSGSESDSGESHKQGTVFLQPNDSHTRTPNHVCVPLRRLQYLSAARPRGMADAPEHRK